MKDHWKWVTGRVQDSPHSLPNTNEPREQTHNHNNIYSTCPALYHALKQSEVVSGWMDWSASFSPVLHIQLQCGEIVSTCSVSMSQTSPYNWSYRLYSRNIHTHTHTDTHTGRHTQTQTFQSSSTNFKDMLLLQFLSFCTLFSFKLDYIR